MLYAIHDALVKPMPGNLMTPSLAESWTVSADQMVYEFKLREGLKFHNGDPFTAEDVKFSFHRAKGSKVLHDKVRDVVIVDPYRIRFQLREAWPDFMTFYGTLVSGASWVVPKKYVERVGDDGFKKQPIGLGPYKFVSHTPGIELVMEANESYWRKMPSVKRLVFKSVPEATTRLAMLKRGGRRRVSARWPRRRGQTGSRLKLAFSGGIATSSWISSTSGIRNRPGPIGACGWPRTTRSIVGRSPRRKRWGPPARGSIVPRTFEFALPLEPYPMIRRGRSSCWRRPAIPTGSMPESCTRRRPISRWARRS